MATFLVAHGAWSAGWAWKKMHLPLSAAGHRLITPTYTGVGERAHLAHADIDLNSHIEDMLAVIKWEGVRDLILVGHSYGGMVATAVADQARDEVAQLVYIDAFAPQDGQSAFDMMPAERAAAMRERARSEGEGWRLPPNPMPPDTGEEDVAWAQTRRMPQPIKTFDTRLRLRNGPLTLPRHYVYCRRCAAGDGFRPSYERAQAEGWQTYELDASHNPHITAPQELTALLHRIAT